MQSPQNPAPKPNARRRQKSVAPLPLSSLISALSVAAVALGLGVAVSGCVEETPASVSLLLESESAPSQSMDVKITLYGFDTQIADQAANVIQTTALTVDALPSAVEFAIPEGAHSMIDPSSGELENHAFYFRVDVDIDQDGQLCEGDLFLNGLDTFQLEGLGADIPLELTPRGAGGCVSLDDA